MTASLHLAAGAAAGIIAQKYLPPDISFPEKAFWVFITGIASHVFIDAFPHQEYLSKGLNLWAIILAESGLICALVLNPVSNMTAGIILFLAMVGGALPDVLELSYEYFLKKEWIAILSSIFHLNMHGKLPLPFEINFWWQSLVTTLLVLFVRIKSA